MDNAPSPLSLFLLFLSKKEFNEKKARDRIGSPPMNYGVSRIYIYISVSAARADLDSWQAWPIVSPRYISACSVTMQGARAPAFRPLYRQALE